jgi:hypothetical protein
MWERKGAYVGVEIGVGAGGRLRWTDLEAITRRPRERRWHRGLEFESVNVVVLLHSRANKDGQLRTDPEAAETREHDRTRKDKARPRAGIEVRDRGRVRLVA